MYFSLTIIHSKGIPLVKSYFAHIDGVSHSVDKCKAQYKKALKSAYKKDTEVYNMTKIFDTNNKIVRQDDQYPIGTVLDFLEDNDIIYLQWKRLSKLIETMTGDASTVFNTIGEMIAEIPEIISCGEECAFLNVINNDRQGSESKWFILGWNYEDDIILCNKILQEYFPGFIIVEK